MSVNIGHGHPKVIKAMKDQLDTLIFSYPGTATEVRAKLSLKLAQIVPGDLNMFFYALGGAGAERERHPRGEAVHRAAQDPEPLSQLPRRHQRHAPAHGRPARRWANEPGMPGVMPEAWTRTRTRTASATTRRRS